jgi:Na+/proline symporter
VVGGWRAAVRMFQADSSRQTCHGPSGAAGVSVFLFLFSLGYFVQISFTTRFWAFREKGSKKREKSRIFFQPSRLLK